MLKTLKELFQGAAEGGAALGSRISSPAGEHAVGAAITVAGGYFAVNTAIGAIAAVAAPFIAPVSLGMGILSGVVMAGLTLLNTMFTATGYGMMRHADSRKPFYSKMLGSVKSIGSKTKAAMSKPRAAERSSTFDASATAQKDFASAVQRETLKTGAPKPALKKDNAPKM